MASDDAATRARANAQTWLDESCGDEPLHDCDDLDWARDVVAAIDGLRAELAERTAEWEERGDAYNRLFLEHAAEREAHAATRRGEPSSVAPRATTVEVVNAIGGWIVGLAGCGFCSDGAAGGDTDDSKQGGSDAG